MRHSFLGLFLGSLLAYVVLLEVAPRLKVPAPLGMALGAVLFTSLATVAAFLGGATIAPMNVGGKLLWFLLGLAGCVTASRFDLGVAVDAFLILAGVGFGALVLLAVRDRNLLVPVALVAAVVDLWGVTKGPTAMALKVAPEVVEEVSLKVASIGSVEPISFVGPGDIFFVALFGSAAVALGLRVWATMGWMVLLLACAMILAAFGPFSVPALPFVAVATLLANREVFSLTREEKIATSAVTAAIALLLAVVSVATAK